MLPYKQWAWDRAGQRKGQQGQQELKTRHILSHSVCFFSFTYLSTKCLFALSLLWWRPPPPPHTISISITNAGLRCSCVSSSGMFFFFCPLLNNYLLIRLHVWNHNQDNNGEWGLETHHLCLESGMFFSFFFLFFIIVLTYRCIHHHHYHPQQQELETQHVSSPGKVFFASFFTFLITILLIECCHTI